MAPLTIRPRRSSTTLYHVFPFCLISLTYFKSHICEQQDCDCATNTVPSCRHHLRTMASTTHPTGIGLTLVQVLPVLGTTASLTWALGELVFLSSLTTCQVLPAPPSPISKYQASAMTRILPPFFNTYFHRGVWVVLAFNTLSWSTLAFNLYLGNLSPSSKSYYKLGLAAVVGHLCFVPFVAGPVKRICDQEPQGSKLGQEIAGPVEELKSWLGVHRVRMCVADLPALVCCVLGFLA